MSDLPKSLKELKALPPERIQSIWDWLMPDERYSRKSIIKTLWYRIQCKAGNIYVEKRHNTRLNRYKKAPEEFIKKSVKYKIKFKAGTEITRIYKGKKHVVTVKDENTFLYDDKEFSTLSAAAIAICGKKVSGNHFFGLHNKNIPIS